jgi:hypothetical protein
MRSKWSDGRCDYCDHHPPDYPPWQHSDWVHNAIGNRDFDNPFPFTDQERRELAMAVPVVVEDGS